MLGKARRITITKDNTTIVAEGNEQAVARCEQIRRQMDETDSSYDKEKLQERLANWLAVLPWLKGAATETEMKDRKLRLEDAINATKAAVEEGIVPGGGTTSPPGSSARVLGNQQSERRRVDRCDDCFAPWLLL